MSGDPESSPHDARHPLLNREEAEAKRVLDEIYEHGEYVVLPGFKLSQVIRSRPPGITLEQWNYATRAHFDFVVADRSYRTEFAVELDGPSHDTPDGQRRDGMKNALCEAVDLELLRIESSALTPGPKGRRLVEYLIDARELGKAFLEQQEAGAIPWDEPYDYRHFLGIGADGRVEFINDLAAPARIAAFAARDAGAIEGDGIRGASFYWKNGWAEGWAWLKFRGDLFFFRSTRLRTYRFFCGMGPGELAEDLSVAAIGEDLAQLETGAATLLRADHIQRRVEATRARQDELEFAGQLAYLSFQSQGK